MMIININALIPILIDKLNNWYKESNLISLYLIGSYSINEHTGESDIDFLGISPEQIEFEKNVVLRNKLKISLVDVFSQNKIGFRIRTLNELSKFQEHAKSWCYDLTKAKKIFGSDTLKNLNSYNSLIIKKTILFDNIIERCWYDILYITLNENSNLLLHKNAKSLFILFKIFLCLQDIYPTSNKETTEYLKKNHTLLDAIFIKKELIEFTIHHINNQSNCSNFSSKYLDKIRHLTLKNIYFNIISDIHNWQHDISSFYYWTYNQDKYYSIDKIKNIFVPENLRKYLNNNEAIWRIILMEFLLEVDNNRVFLPTKIYLFKLKNIIEKIFLNKKNIPHDIQDHRAVDILIQIENLRLKTSPYGRDSSRKFEQI